MKSLVKILKALADPTRLRILKLLENRELCVCEITEVLAIPQPTVSNHLKVLEAVELVEKRKEGLWVHYRLAAVEGQGAVPDLLGQMRRWLNDDDEVRRLLEKLPGIDREIICKKFPDRPKGARP